MEFLAIRSAYASAFGCVYSGIVLARMKRFVA